MASAAIISPSEEKLYCFKLWSLTVDGGTLVLRHQFDRIVPPQDLQTKLSDASVRGKLNNLRINKVITAKQYQQVYPPFGQPSSEDFDVSLFTCLLRYICNMDENSPKWNRIPSSRDISLEDDITRLKLIRNEISHKQMLSLSEQDFIQKWNDTEQVILRLGHGIPNLQDNIEALKEGPFDPVKEKKYRELFEDWESSDRMLKQQLSDFKADLQRHERDISELKQTTTSQQTKEFEILASIKEHDEIIKNVKENTDETSDNVHRIKTQLQTFEAQLDHVGKEQSKLEQIVGENAKSQTSETSKVTERLTQAEESITMLNKGYRSSSVADVSSEFQSLTSMTRLYFEDTDQQPFVVTRAYVQAKEKLQKSNIVVLTGQPGEGKTANAEHLVSEVSKPSTCLKLRGPSDWKHIDPFQDTFDTVFIDDIFGDSAFDETLFQGWNPYLQYIEMAARRKRLYVIITCRHYILNEAKERLRRSQIFSEKNVQQLSSSNLTNEERTRILISQLEFANRERSDTFVEKCNNVYRSSFLKKDQKNTKMMVSEDSTHPENEYEMNAMMGFPEMVHMFANTDYLFNKGSQFFDMPAEFFKRCLEDLFVDKSKFIALILMWANPENKLRLSDIEPPNTAGNIKEIAKLFGVQIDDNSVESLLLSLKYLSGGILRYNSRTGEYSFCHNIVRDMVGIIAGYGHPFAVINLASHDFFMNFITSMETKRDGFHVYVEEFRFKSLLDSILKVIMPGLTSDQGKTSEKRISPFPGGEANVGVVNWNFTECFILGPVIDISKLIVLPLCSDFIPTLTGLYLESWDCESISIFGHDIFTNKVFLNLFFNSEEGKLVLSKPVASFQESCELERDFGICLDGNVKIYLPTFSLFFGNGTLLSEYMENVFDRLDEDADDFLHTSLLIATDLDMVKVIKMLLSYGAKPTEDHFIIATAKNTMTLDQLLNNWDKSITQGSHIKNKTSSLIFAASRGYVRSIKCLLRHGMDVNYRNTNKRSALDKAVQYGKTEVCQILLKNGAKVNERVGKFKRTPLHVAADMGHDQCTELHRVVEVLLEYGASTQIKDYRGHFPIHCAAIRGHNKVVRILLQRDIAQMDVRITSPGRKSIIKGMNLLQIAVWKSNTELVEVLIKNNVDPDVKDCFGRTALYCAAYDGKADIIRLLLGISNAKLAEKNGFTPLHAAIHKRHTDIAKLLCPHSEINAQDRFGKTPLHTACKTVNFEIIRMLVQNYNSDIRMITKKCMSVFHLLQDKSLFCFLDDFSNDILGIPSTREQELEDCKNFLSERDPEFAAKFSDR